MIPGSENTKRAPNISLKSSLVVNLDNKICSILNIFQIRIWQTYQNDLIGIF